MLKYKISARVVSIHTLKPLDVKEIQNAINDTGGIVTIEENSNWWTPLALYLNTVSKIIYFLKKFRRIGISDKFSSIVGTQDYLRKINHLDSISIAKQVLELIN